MKGFEYDRKPLEEEFKIPHDVLPDFGGDWISEKPGKDTASPHDILKEHSVKGWRISHNSFDVTSMYVVIAYQVESRDYLLEDDIREYRYAQNGKLYKIAGKAHFTDITAYIEYSVYFYSDGSS
ncbi:MAG: hypothetical protein LBU11_05040 [Zoogloeaceae bacterium]|jgi:hypothetical protein|nr:hypothetical protein [Zoogloeaceae bacterium]